MIKDKNFLEVPKMAQ
uniref:Uncharacterized protein n=1 Tax=Parastrongyloides trichosuri TaxID=131310 RepID=A0A0N4Z1L0_PARTI